MAAAFVQEDHSRDGSGTVSTINVSLTGVTGGNTFIVCVGTDNATRTLTSVQDDLSNSFVITPGSPYSGVQRMWICYLLNITGGSRLITVQLSGVAPVTMFAQEVSGLSASPLDDEDGQAFGGVDGTHITAPNVVPTLAGDYLVEASIAPNIVSVANGWTLAGIQSGCAHAWQVAGGPGSYPADFTGTLTGNWEVVVAAFKAASATPPATPFFDLTPGACVTWRDS